MTPRRPPGNFETWVEKEIREAMERGEFHGLEGEGRPISDLHEPSDELRWVRQKLKREGFTFLPASLALRRDAQEARDAAGRARTEDEARHIIEAINERLLDAVRKPLDGPSVYVPPYDVEAVLARWRTDHAEALAAAEAEADAARRAAAEAATEGRRRRLLRRWRRTPA